MKKILNEPKITFIIPIYNSSHFLIDCLESIKKQDYPKNKIEVVVPDGGSKDNGPKVAKKYNCKVIKNFKILAEPGFMLGAETATGDLIAYMSADNRLAERDWIKKMIKPFLDEDIMGAFPWHRNDPKNTWLTKYFNVFTDPINHFVLQNSCNPRFFYKAYDVIKKNSDYEVYNFTLDNFPMLAFDQGFVQRKTYRRPPDTEYDDILPVLDMIKKKMPIAFVPGASNYHFTLENGLTQFSRKMRWIIDNNIDGKPKFGFPTRRKNLNMARKIRFYLWPLYAISIIGPLSLSLYGLLTTRRKEWIYHAPITYIMVVLIIYEFLRVKILKRPSLVSRQ